MEDRYMTLAEATASALGRGGAGVMDSPSRFLAQVADVMDPDGDEMRVLMLLRLCNDSLLAPYREALAGAAGPDVASARARDYLEHECRIEPGTAAAVASGLADGVARYLAAARAARREGATRPPAPSPASGGLRRPGHERTLAIAPGPPTGAAGPQAADVSGAMVGPIAPQRHTGEPLRPVPRVTLGGRALVPGADFTLAYADNVGSADREAEATVTVTGTGAYSGSCTATFRILPSGRPRPSRGEDVTVGLEVTAAEARDGASKRVEYDLPSGGRRESCEVRVPAGSADGDLVRVPGMGGHGADGGGRGDLVARLRVAQGGPATLTRRSALALAGGALGLAAGALALRWARHGWRDLVAVSAGREHTVGLRSDGTAVATGGNDRGQCDVSGWGDLVAVSAGGLHTVGLRSDGTAVATGYDRYGRCDVSGWRDLVAVSAGDDHTVGLRSDGTAVATGDNEYGQCDVSGWHDLVAVSAGGLYTVGLRSDGTAVATGFNYDGECDVSGWHDLVAVSSGWDTVGLRSDGTAVATGYNGSGQCDVSGWRDLVAVSAGREHTVGLRSDGTAVAVGWKAYGMCDVSGWRDLVAVSAGGYWHTVGLRSDGTAVATGDNSLGQCDVSGWRDLARR